MSLPSLTVLESSTDLLPVGDRACSARFLAMVGVSPLTPLEVSSLRVGHVKVSTSLLRTAQLVCSQVQLDSQTRSPWDWLLILRVTFSCLPVRSCKAWT